VIRLRDPKGRFTSKQRTLPHLENLCSDCNEGEAHLPVNGIGRVMDVGEHSWIEGLREWVLR
jgi:hypothetical protein